MYYSAIIDGRFVVVASDGIFSSPLIELPTEELADKVAFELQKAWDEGKAWGEQKKLKELDSETYYKQIGESIKKFRSMSPEQQAAYSQKMNRRLERIKKVQDARRWKSVLSWKK